MSDNRRAVTLRAIQRTRLGGPDHIRLDMFDDEPLARYAHIYDNGMGPVLHTTDDPQVSDPVYGEGVWKLVGVIDLDTGDVVPKQMEGLDA